MNKFGQIVSNFDTFGEKVTLNFRGKDSFKTKRGGFLTLIIYSIVLWQVLILLN